MPHDDFVERKLNMRHCRLVPALLAALGVDERRGSACAELRCWLEGAPGTDPAAAHGAELGDLSLVAAKLAEQRLPPSHGRKLRVSDVNQRLDEIAAASAAWQGGAGATPRKGGGSSAACTALLRRCSALEIKWAVRIMLRDLRVGRRGVLDPQRAAWPRAVLNSLCDGAYP
jgi:hypothetical protein